MEFRRQDRERVANGDITVTFRLWKRAQVKAGNRYQTACGVLEVDDVQVIPAAMISPDDVPATGCDDIAAIWALAGEHTQTTVTPETLLHRVQFHVVPAGQPSRAPVALSPDDVRRRLAAIDRRSDVGPWTERVLRLIEANPRVPARLLAAEMGWPTLEFKARVRRLKALALTISHEVGYELSDAGRRLLSQPRGRMHRRY